VLAGRVVDLARRVSITLIVCSAATDDKVVVHDFVSSVEAVVLITALESVCSLLAVGEIFAITAVRGVGATPAPKVVIVQTAEERVGINAADFLAVFFDQLLIPIVPAFLLSTCGSLPCLRQD
jgi:hypothetical protein